MKKVCALLSLFLCLLALIFCGQGEDEVVFSPKAEEEKPPLTVQKEEKEWYPYDLSEYVVLPDPFGVRAKYDEVGICTEKEVEDAIFLIRLGVAEFQKKEGILQQYDRATVDFELVVGGQVEEKKELQLVLGTDAGDEALNALSEALLGAQLGEMRWADYTYPESTFYGEYSGKTVVAKGTVTSIESPILPEYNEEFVHSIAGYEDYSVAEFSVAIKKDILKEKETAKINAVWSAFCAGVTVLGYPEEELKDYQTDYVLYYSQFAKAMDMELEAFLSQYMEMDLDTFEKDAQAYAEEMVKNDMIFVALSRLLGISLSQEEYLAGAAEYFSAESGEFDTLEDFIDHYSEENIRQNLIRDKALMKVVENSVRIQE